MAITSTISHSNISTIDNNNNHDDCPNCSPAEDHNRSPVGSCANRSFNSIDLDYEDDPLKPRCRSITPGQAIDIRGLGYNNRGNDNWHLACIPEEAPLAYRPEFDGPPPSDGGDDGNPPDGGDDGPGNNNNPDGPPPPPPPQQPPNPPPNPNLNPIDHDQLFLNAFQAIDQQL